MKIIVTGASSGIGKQIYEDLKALRHEPFGVGIGGPDLDISFDPNSVDESRLIKRVYGGGHTFDALVNCAGTIQLAALPMHKPWMFHEVLWINLHIPYVLSHGFITQGSAWTGRIVNISSMAVVQPGRECPGYSASKAGLEAMTRAMAKEFGGGRITFACVAPGSVGGTEMDLKGKEWLKIYRGMDETSAQAYVNGLFGRQITPAEVSKVVQFALFDMPETMTGTILRMPAASGL